MTISLLSKERKVEYLIGSRLACHQEVSYDSTLTRYKFKRTNCKSCPTRYARAIKINLKSVFYLSKNVHVLISRSSYNLYAQQSNFRVKLFLYIHWIVYIILYIWIKNMPNISLVSLIVMYYMTTISQYIVWLAHILTIICFCSMYTLQTVSNTFMVTMYISTSI